MKRFPIELLSIATALIVHPAFARAESKYIWTNAKGVVSAADCKIGSSAQTALQISQHVSGDIEQAENLRTLKGKTSIAVVDGSLVKMIPATKDNGRKFVQVIGATKAPKSLPSTLKPAARLSQGYLPNESLKDVGDYVLELKAGTPKLALDKSHPKLQGTFWQAATVHDNYLTYVCGQGPAKKVYLVFDVFVRESKTPVARVGVNSDETQIFRSIQTYTGDQAEQVIAANEPTAKKPATQPSVTASVSTATKPVLQPSATPAPKPAPKTVSKPISKPPTPIANSPSAPKPVLPTPTPWASPTPVPPGPGEKTAAQTTAQPSVPVITGNLEYLVCIADGSVSVRDQKLEKVLFTAKKNSEAKPMQSFGNEKQTKIIDGKSHTFIKVMFPAQKGSEKIGWVASELIKAKSDCASAPKTKADTAANDDEDAQTSGVMTITGLTDKNCCEFPLTARPTTSYRSGMRRFGAGRSGGRRIHAACDLYRDDGDKVVAVASGRVIMPKYYFYQGVFAIEVRHAGGFVVRYGEVLGDNAPGIHMGAEVKAGQTVGYVGTVNSGCCSPMLHFELYSGEGRGSLTQHINGYSRREDLLNPTEYLSKWEQKKFSESF